MTGRLDLHGEAFGAVGRVGAPELRRMEALGVPRSAIARLGQRQPPFGVGMVRACGDGLFEPADDGCLAIIVPVCTPSAFDFFGVECDSLDIIDLIAFRSDQPLRWRWRTGEGWALGGELLDGDAPINLVAHPLAWLREAGEALCLLDWSLTPQRWRALREAPPIVAHDEVLRQRVNTAFSRQTPPLVRAPTTSKRKRHAA